ncbi:hypothetical protein ABL78_3958 [Leptomonas seymouri]|uniref:Uncharacterized protein n=1 Tax=Leptomonas seymouri TaxID=5684 RepID=A0A0N0P6B5_LEPSE|nr:hypothetical protein ABL78_3958 [Leptomonas seymouri]|eukprot:KPI86967.1 hypothetical protein ABL78_3958 [Leptomonas seymouri]
MFSSSPPSPSWRHHVQDQEEELVRELMQADDVDTVLARMEGNHFRHLSPVMRKLGAFDGTMQQAQSPSQRPPPPPPPPPPTHEDYDPLNAYRRPAPAPAPTSLASTRAPLDQEAESRYNSTMDSWLKPNRDIPLDNPHDSSISAMQHADPLGPTRPSARAAFETSSLAPDKMLPPPTPGSPWDSSGGRYHGGPSTSRGVEPAPTTSNRSGSDPQRAPRITTTLTPTAFVPPRPPLSRSTAAEVRELENGSQSRIARQLQLLRNYRELAELCSATKDPSVDLFRSLPTEELSRMQVEQLQHLPQREQSPITVNNNYYFDSTGSHRGSEGGGVGRSGVHSSGRSGRGRINSSDTVGALSRTGAAPAGVGSDGGGNSRSVSELLTVDSHPGLTSYQPSGASSPQPQRPPLLPPSPRIIPLQSPQLSSGTDSPVATPPRSQRGGASGGAAVPPPLLAPPSPSRSYRTRSHRSRHYDAHYTPTATTEEAGSSYEEDGAEDEEEDYEGDLLDNDNEQDGDDYDDATAPRPPPPRIIEREQHRRFPHNNSNGDYSTSNAQSPLSPVSQQQLQKKLQSQQQQQQQQQHWSYPGSHMKSPGGIAIGASAGMAESSLPSNLRSGSNSMPPGMSRNSMGGIAGSDAGRRSVSSAINVLSGDQELRANAQLGASGMVESRRGSVSQPPQQQPLQQRHIIAHNGNRSLPLLPVSYNHQQQQLRRSVSAGSSPRKHRCGSGALTDPGFGSFSDPFSVSIPRRDAIPGMASRGGNSTPEKHLSGASNSSSRVHFDHQHRGGQGKNSRGANSNAHRQGNRRGGRGRDHDGHPHSDEDSDYTDGDFSPYRHGNNSSVSGGDTPGNPQLQTHSPRSSAMRRKRQNQQQQQRQRNTSAHAIRTLTNASGSRGQQRDGWNDDGTVHTPRAQSPAARQKADNRNTRTYRQQSSEASRRHGRRSRHNREPSPSYYDDDGGEMNSASMYSYSYTTSSGISDYVAGSYYSPIDDQTRVRGLGNNNRMNNYSGGCSPMRGRGRGNASPANSPQQLSGAYPAGRTSPGYNGNPQQGRGRGGAPAAMSSGRGRGRINNPVMSNNVDHAGDGVSYPYYNSAAPRGRGRGGKPAVGSPQSANRRASGNPVSGRVEGGGQAGSLLGSTPQRNSGHPTPFGGEGAHNSGITGGHARSPYRAGAIPAGAQGGAPTAAATTAAAATVPANAFVQLPNGLTVPANSPAGRQYQQMLLQPSQHPLFGYSPSSGLYPAGAAAMSRLQPQMSAATSPSRVGRAASPSIAPSNVNASRNASPGAVSGVHIHPGLLYGSLLPKARPKTALVMEDDKYGREHSVATHGGTAHEPLLDRGSVCPVLPTSTSLVPPRTVFNPAQMDTFPVTSAINGATADGVQPLAWKSGGSGCVVGRSGHVPPAPSAKLSSHYRAPDAQPSRRGAAERGAASSVGGSGFPFGNVPQQQQLEARPVLGMIEQQHFHPLRLPVTGRQDSAYTPQSQVTSQAQQHAMVGAGNSQQRYVPMQEPLEPTRRRNEMNADNDRSPGFVDPYAQHGRAAAERSANAKRFGIAPVQN